MTSLLSSLIDIVGQDYATDAETTRKSYSLTQAPNLFFFPDKFPDYVVYPQTTMEVSAVMRLADRTRTPVLVRGSGTSPISGNLALKGGILLDLRHMDKILEINEENMVVVAEAGCSTYKIIHECHKKGLMVPLAPEWQAAPQIGANIATNATGWHIGRTGRIGDIVVGLEVVLPTGEVVTLGSGAYEWGHHYHRYVGGPDLIGLFVDSGGTLGVITKVALRLLNSPKMAYFTYGWSRDKIKEVARAHYELQRYAEILGIGLMNRNSALGFESIDITPRVKIPEDIFFVMCIIQAGQTDEELGARGKQVAEIAEGKAGKNLGDIWGRIAGPPRYWWYTNFAESGACTAGNVIRPIETPIGLNGACTLIYCPTLMFPEVYELAHEVYVQNYGFPEGNYLWFSWADRNAMNPYPAFLFNATAPGETKKFAEFWRDFHLKAGKMGCVSYHVGIGHPKELLEWLGPAHELMKKVKRMLDPNDILNPAA